MILGSHHGAWPSLRAWGRGKRTHSEAENKKTANDHGERRVSVRSSALTINSLREEKYLSGSLKGKKRGGRDTERGKIEKDNETIERKWFGAKRRCHQLGHMGKEKRKPQKAKVGVVHSGEKKD